MAKKTFYHITLWNKEYQKVLIPRIPEQPSYLEDCSIKRISVSPSIMGCIRGMGNADLWNEEKRIRVYSADFEEENPDLINWKTLYNKGFVNDTPITHEYWFKKCVMPDSYSEYQIENIKCKMYYIVPSSERKRIIDLVQNMGIFIPEPIKEATATEILNYCSSCSCFENLLDDLVHYKIEESPVELEIEMKIFGYITPPKKKRVEDFEKCRYVETCDLIKLKEVCLSSNETLF